MPPSLPILQHLTALPCPATPIATSLTQPPPPRLPRRASCPRADRLPAGEKPTFRRAALGRDCGKVGLFPGEARLPRHGYRRRSPRNETLFVWPGRFYDYVSYGIHLCVNIGNPPVLTFSPPQGLPPFVTCFGI